ncbi:MAG: hypothetical protein H0W87_07005 [Actinobacteria bacterium]|nr:hypothetical protein [Actinomycetota bacterium]
MVDPLIAFATHAYDPPAVEVRVNFGMLAGREATPAEIDDLAAVLLKAAPQVSIISEQRHEIGREVEASLHQVRIELQHDVVSAEPAALDSLERSLVAAAESWAINCAAARQVDV